MSEPPLQPVSFKPLFLHFIDLYKFKLRVSVSFKLQLII